MNSRKLLGIALAATALYAGVLVVSASAELHRVQVTLVTGQVLTVTVDVPAGTPVQQVQIPGHAHSGAAMSRRIIAVSYQLSEGAGAYRKRIGLPSSGTDA